MARRYIIDVPGDNDHLHAKALEAAVKAIEETNVGVEAAVVIAPESPGMFERILNCVTRVK